MNEYPSPTTPAWSPDGEKIAFWLGEESGDSSGDICMINADGTGRRCVADAVHLVGAGVEWASAGARAGASASASSTASPSASATSSAPIEKLPDNGGVSSTWMAMAAVLALIGCGIGAIALVRRSFT